MFQPLWPYSGRMLYIYRMVLKSALLFIKKKYVVYSAMA